MLLFVAATIFTFASCNKDDDNNGGSGSGSSSPVLGDVLRVGRCVGFAIRHKLL